MAIVRVIINSSNQATDGTTALDYVDQYNNIFWASEGEIFLAEKTSTKYLLFRDKLESKAKTLAACEYTNAEYTTFNYVALDVDTLGQILDFRGGADEYENGVIEPAYLLVTVAGVNPPGLPMYFKVPRYVIDGTPQYSDDDSQPLYLLESVPPGSAVGSQEGWKIYNYYGNDTWGGVTDYFHGLRIEYTYNFPYWPSGYYGAAILYIKPGPSSTPYNVWGATDLVYRDQGGTWVDEDPWGTPINWPVDKPTTTTCTVRPKGIYKPPA